MRQKHPGKLCPAPQTLRKAMSSFSDTPGTQCPAPWVLKGLHPHTLQVVVSRSLSQRHSGKQWSAFLSISSKSMALLFGCVGIAIGRARAVGTRPLVGSHILDSGHTTCQDQVYCGPLCPGQALLPSLWSWTRLCADVCVDSRVEKWVLSFSAGSSGLG